MKTVKNALTQIKVRRYLFFVVMLTVVLLSCDIDTSVPKILKFTDLDEKYQVVFKIFLTKEKPPEEEITIANWPAAMSPEELIAEISNGTAATDLYKYKYYNDTDHIISKKRWSGSGAYFVTIALRDRNEVDNFVSKDKILITEAVTEIVFESNFEYLGGLRF